MVGMALVSWLERWDELGTAETLNCWGRGWRQRIRGKWELCWE